MLRILWNAERANMGQTFENFPVGEGFSSRYLVPVTSDGLPHFDCLVHHLPNNFACQDGQPHGKLPISQCFDHRVRTSLLPIAAAIHIHKGTDAVGCHSDSWEAQDNSSAFFELGTENERSTAINGVSSTFEGRGSILNSETNSQCPHRDSSPPDLPAGPTSNNSVAINFNDVDGPEPAQIKPISCGIVGLYSDWGFYDSPEIFSLLWQEAHLAEETIRFEHELFPKFSRVRAMPKRIAARDERLASDIVKLFEWVNFAENRGAPTRLFLISDAAVSDNVAYCCTADGWRVVYETHRSNDRLWVACSEPDCRSAPNFIESAEGEAPLFIGSAGSSNYGHWLVDDVPRLKAVEILLADKRFSSVSVYFVSCGDPMDHVKSVTVSTLFKGKSVSVFFLKPERFHMFKRLFYVSPVSYHPILKSADACLFARTRLLAAAETVADLPRRLFVERSSSRGRSIVNTHEVRSWLEARQFEAVDVAMLSPFEQASVFASATIVVGCMGAAMTNTMFCPIGTPVIYLAPEGWKEPFYWDLASVFRQPYTVCYGNVVNHEVPAHASAFEVSLDLLELALMET